MPKLDGKEYEYTEEGIEQYEEDKMKDQMSDLIPMEEEQEMLPDEQMEDDYTDFIIGESLAPEDEEYLLTALEQDDRLSMIFDQVVDTASEFSGSEVEADDRERRIMQAGGYVEEAQEEQQEEQEIVRAIQPKERQGRLMPRSLADKKVNESMIALNPRNSLFAR